MKLLSFLHFLQLHDWIIRIKHANYQTTNFHFELWNLHQELESVHVIHPLKSEIDWSAIWKVISLFLNIHLFCDIWAEFLPPQGSSGGVCKRATHKMVRLVSNIWEERKIHIKLCSRTRITRCGLTSRTDNSGHVTWRNVKTERGSADSLIGVRAHEKNMAKFACFLCFSK